MKLSECRRKEYDVFKNVICFDAEGFSVDGENIDFREFKAETDRLFKRYKRKKRFFIFVNHLFNMNGWKIKMPENAEKVYDPWTDKLKYIETDRAFWIDFKSFSGNMSVEDIRKDYGFCGDNCSVMTQYIMFRIEHGFQFKKEQLTITSYINREFNNSFSKEEKEELKEEMNYHVLSHDVLEDLLHQSRNPNLGCENGLYDKAFSYDISSDFTAIMCRLSNYPIGKIKQCSEEEVRKRYKEHKWFAVIMKADNIPYFPEQEDGIYCLTLYDVKYLKLRGVNVFSCGEVLRCYCSTKSSYLHKIFRDKLVSYYKKKQTSTGAKRALYKLSLNTFYGYGLRGSLIEYYGPSNFISKPSMYLTPAISGHTVAYARFYLEYMKRKFKNIAYHDTDCIKTTDENADEIFAAENERIHEEMKKAGYDCSLGQWQKESEGRLMVYGKKKYAYETSDGFVCKFAGCSKDAWKQIESFDELLKTKTVKNGKPAGANKYDDYSLESA